MLDALLDAPDPCDCCEAVAAHLGHVFCDRASQTTGRKVRCTNALIWFRKGGTCQHFTPADGALKEFADLLAGKELPPAPGPSHPMDPSVYCTIQLNVFFVRMLLAGGALQVMTMTPHGPRLIMLTSSGGESPSSFPPRRVD